MTDKRKRLKLAVIGVCLILSVLMLLLILSEEKPGPESTLENFKAYCSNKCNERFLLSNDCLNGSYVYECLCLDGEGRLRPETWTWVRYNSQKIRCNP